MRIINADTLRERCEVNAEGWFCHREITMAEAMKMLCEMIEDAPTIEVAPVVHGRWMKFVYDTRWVKCSKCGCNWERRIVEECDMGYCPNCGAKMDAEE